MTDKEKIEQCINFIGLVLYEGNISMSEFCEDCEELFNDEDMNGDYCYSCSSDFAVGYGLLKEGLKHLREKLRKQTKEI